MLDQYNFPVELQDAYTPNGRQIKGKKAVVRTDTGNPLSIVTNRYSLITHEEVVEPLKEVFKNLGGFKESVYLRKDGAILDYTADFVERKMALLVGDTCGLRVHVRNSYDGQGSTNVRIGAVVLSCTNGMVRDGGRFEEIRLRHVGSNHSKLVFPSVDAIVADFEDGVKFWSSLSSAGVDNERYQSVIADLQKNLVLTPKQATEWADKPVPKTAWELMQNVTYNITHERDRVGYGAKLDMLGRANWVFERNFIN